MVSLRISIAFFLLGASLYAGDPKHYALLLDDPPAAGARSVVRIAADTRTISPESMAAAARIRATQTLLQAELARRRFSIAGSTQLLLNAVFVTTDASRVPELSRLPGVRRVVLLPRVRPALDHAEQLVNTGAAWDILGGMSNAGLGIRVAVIDSGIDQGHAAFQDPSLTPPPGFPACQPEDCAFTSNKVIVARSYIRQQAAGTAPDPAADSRPDDFSPRDHVGHGTAVAMIVAGVTNTGPGDTITGFAPKAFLGNYKIFGSPGVNDSASEDAVISALEDAVKDGMDIANLSLGGPPLTGPDDDTLSQAVENASGMGLLVVAAAGNEGLTGKFSPTLATIDSPGIAPSAIAVGASTNSHVWRSNGAGWTSQDVTTYNTVANFSSRGPAIGTAAIKPEITAVGTELFLTAQRYDPNGVLYNSTGYTISQGTSFSTPMVAGAAALVKQAHPTWQPSDIKSALVNTATQDLTDRGVPAAIVASGAGKLNCGNALAANITVNPATASFGAVSSLPLSRTFEIRNHGAAPVTLQITSQPANLTFDQTTVSLAPGARASLQAALSGSTPPPGSYEGFIVLAGDTVTLRIPYLYLVGDGIPANAIELQGDGGTGLAGDNVPDGMLAFKIIDRFGLPVPGVPVSFTAPGAAQIANAASATDQYGVAAAEAIMSPIPGSNTFSSTAAGMTLFYTDQGLAQPVIADNGIVNSASFQTGQGIAPGSYVSIFGSNLSATSGSGRTPNLPVSIHNVSVSFDVPETNLSLPGHLMFVSPNQVNVQVPWELRGQPSARIKVSIEAASGAVSAVAVADYSPGMFASAQDSSYMAISSAHPAMRGETIILYGNGLGPVNHPPASGDPAPDASSTTVTPPVVTIAGVPAQVQFSGLAPGYAGLYQINVTVPTEVPAGMQAVDVTVNGIAANRIMLPIQ